jgi:hypothetical protein
MCVGFIPIFLRLLINTYWNKINNGGKKLTSIELAKTKHKSSNLITIC